MKGASGIGTSLLVVGGDSSETSPSSFLKSPLPQNTSLSPSDNLKVITCPCGTGPLKPISFCDLESRGPLILHYVLESVFPSLKRNTLLFRVYIYTMTVQLRSVFYLCLLFSWYCSSNKMS